MNKRFPYENYGLIHVKINMSETSSFSYVVFAFALVFKKSTKT